MSLHIGVSLPPRIVVSKPTALFAALHECGVESIELRALAAYGEAQLGSDCLRILSDEGFGCTIHSYLPTASVPLYIGSLPTDGTPHVVVVHALSDRVSTVPELAERTASVLSELVETDRNHIYALEIDRIHDRLDPANSVEGVWSILGKAGNPKLGICFDMGHFYWNQSACLHSPDALPPKEWLERAVHTHIHGLVGDETHHALLPGSLPIGFYVNALKSVGYGGIYNLEIAYKNLDDGDGAFAPLRASVACLTEALK